MIRNILFIWASKADIENLSTKNQLSVNREQVRKQCDVLEHVTDTVKVIGVSYRGTNSEAVYIIKPLLDEVYVRYYQSRGKSYRGKSGKNPKTKSNNFLYCRFQAENNKRSS